jgi:tungstate transport system substrate-binding protein
LPEKKAFAISILFLLVGFVGACGGGGTEPGLLKLATTGGGTDPGILKLATTTSVENSGLLPEILPLFEEEYHAEVDVIAVGTGQALALGERGDVDAVLVHAPTLEEEFITSGYGSQRYAIMYNDFVIVGPADDFAGISNLSDITTVFTVIAFQGNPFASRGDNSGTHHREMLIWEDVGFTPSADDFWYFSIGQGMGATLNFTNEERIYTLTDRGTFLALSENLPNLEVLFGGKSAYENPDPALLNYYSVIPVNPELHPHVNAGLAEDFIQWITSLPIQEKIGDFGVERFGIPLFYPNSEEWQRHIDGETSTSFFHLGEEEKG